MYMLYVQDVYICIYTPWFYLVWCNTMQFCIVYRIFGIGIVRLCKLVMLRYCYYILFGYIYICKLDIALSLYLLLLCILYLYKIHNNIVCPRTDICHANTKKSQFGLLTISAALVSFTDVMSENLAGGQARAHARSKQELRLMFCPSYLSLCRTGTDWMCRSRFGKIGAGLH